MSVELKITFQFVNNFYLPLLMMPFISNLTWGDQSHFFVIFVGRKFWQQTERRAF